MDEETVDLYNISVLEFIEILYSMERDLYDKIYNYIKPHYYRNLMIELYSKSQKQLVFSYYSYDLSWEIKWKNFIADNIKYKDMFFFLYFHNMLLCNMTQKHILTLMKIEKFRIFFDKLVIQDMIKFQKKTVFKSVEVPERILNFEMNCKIVIDIFSFQSPHFKIIEFTKWSLLELLKTYNKFREIKNVHNSIHSFKFTIENQDFEVCYDGLIHTR